ncbi:9429_t:CDS:2, partial [Funneliformis geosporum]
DIEENETVEQITVKALIPKEIISTGGTDIGQTPYVNHQIPLKFGEYSVNCTLCGTIITTALHHECIIGYNLRQLYPEMVPETLSTEVFWDIPEEVQRNDEACLAA